jgi:zeaxanthin glucosyltransferase
MVALPVTNDLGVAARIAWTGTGEVLPLKELKADSGPCLLKFECPTESFKTRPKPLI